MNVVCACIITVISFVLLHSNICVVYAVPYSTLQGVFQSNQADSY